MTIAQEFPVFSQVRGSGLLLGAVLADAWHGQARQVQEAARQAGLLVLQAGPDVMRIAPSLVISEADIAEAMQRLRQALAKLAG
jgi:acetylornithine/N-succinyldiaminopimelate aminotransferase